MNAEGADTVSWLRMIAEASASIWGLAGSSNIIGIGKLNYNFELKFPIPMTKRSSALSNVNKSNADSKKGDDDDGDGKSAAESGHRLQPKDGKISLRILASSKERKGDNLLRITLKSPSMEGQTPPPIELASPKTVQEPFNTLVDIAEYMNGLLMEQLEPGDPPEGYAPRQLALVFETLPSRRRYPDYYKVIERPLSLKSIMEQVRAGRYVTKDELMADYETMFKNAQIYNQQDSIIYKDASLMLGFIRKLAPRLTLATRRERKAAPRRESPVENELISVDDGESDRRRNKVVVQAAPVPQKVVSTPLQVLFTAAARDDIATVLALLNRPPEASSSRSPADARLPTIDTITRHYAVWPSLPQEVAALDNVRWSVAHCAAYFGAVNVIDALVERCGVGVLESRDALYDSTALAWAAFGKQFEMCERLIIAYGACTTVKNWMLQTPLELVGADLSAERIGEWRALLVSTPAEAPPEAHRVSLLVSSLVARVLRMEHSGRPYSALLGAASWRSLAMAKPVVTEFLVEAIRRCRECQRFVSLRSASTKSEDATNAVAESIVAFLAKSLPREWTLIESRCQASGPHLPPAVGMPAILRSQISSAAAVSLPLPLRRWDRSTASPPAFYMPRRLAPPPPLQHQMVSGTTASASGLTQLHHQLAARPPSTFGLALASSSGEQCAGSIFVPVRVFLSDAEQKWRHSWALTSVNDARATSIHVPDGVEMLLLELELESSTAGDQEQDFVLLHNQTERVEPLAERPRIRFKVHLSVTRPVAFDSVELFQRGTEYGGLFLFATMFLHVHASKE